MNYPFPKDFIWGVGGSAFQMEGAMLEDGKTLNMREAAFYDKQQQYEIFMDPREPDVCCDFYHRYPEDLALMGQLPGVTFRYSISWARIIPSKDAEPNQKGIDFYNKVIDTMIANGITPFMDLLHSDTPMWVIEAGGVANPEFVQWYARYAEICFRAFGDRVKYWSTVNEPTIGIFEAYANARGMPYEKDIGRAMEASHNMILAHFEAVRRLRKLWPDAKIGMVITVGENYCHSFEQADMDACQRKVAYRLLYADPAILGDYPKELMAYEPLRRYFTDQMRAQVKETFVPMDFCGVNYYSAFHARSGNKSILGTMGFDPKLPKDAYGFTTYAPGLFDVMYQLNQRYNGKPLLITENGYAQRREAAFGMDLEPLHSDTIRQNYMREHIRECARLIRAGVNLQGYFYWSFMDSWEYRNGFNVPMGLVGVNFDTQERRPRESFYYYQNILKHNMID